MTRPGLGRAAVGCSPARAIAAAAGLLLHAGPGAALYRQSANATLPSLDPAAHPLIGLVTTDKAVYAPGAAGRVLVTVRNATRTTLAAQVRATIYRDTVRISTASVEVRASPSASIVAELPFVAPDAGERGYRVAVTVSLASGAVRDSAVSAIDVQAAKLHARFPRQCWVSRWDGTVDAAALIAGHVAWHCNTVQSYASYYRPELAPPAALRSWRSLSNLIVTRAAIRDVVAAAHAANIPVGFFQATGEAYADWPSQPVRPSLAWGSFRDRCGLRTACTAGDLDRSPPLPGNWSRYGWQADHLDFFDPCNPGWQDFLLERSIRPMMAQFAFDFWQADTVGAPVQPTFDSAGRPLDTARCLTALTNGAQVRLGQPVILNAVSGWGLAGAARDGRQPYLYRETWDFDTPYYPGLNGLVADVTAAMRGRAARAVVQPAYLNRALAEQCASGPQADACTVNPPAALLATAMFAIAGSTWMNHADRGCIVTNVFIEGYQLPCSPALVDALLSYKAVEVAYESLLRDGSRDSSRPCTIVSGGRGSRVGAAGQVYLVSKARPGQQICHLLNLTGVAANDWADLKGVKEQPTPLGALKMKLYYAGHGAPHGRHMLWSASPDSHDGAAQRVPFTDGNDEGGDFVAFTVPALRYWTMVVFDTDEGLVPRIPRRRDQS